MKFSMKGNEAYKHEHEMCADNCSNINLSLYLSTIWGYYQEFPVF